MGVFILNQQYENNMKWPTIKLQALLAEQRDADRNNNGYPDRTETAFATGPDHVDADDVAMLQRIASGAELDIADYMSMDALYKHGYVTARGELTDKGRAALTNSRESM